MASHAPTPPAALRLAALALALCLLGAAPARAGLTWGAVRRASRLVGPDAQMTGSVTAAEAAQGGVRLRLT